MLRLSAILGSWCFVGFNEWYCWSKKSGKKVEVGSLSHYRVYIHPRWCRISSIQSKSTLIRFSAQWPLGNLIGTGWLVRLELQKRGPKPTATVDLLNISDYTTMYNWNYTTPKGWLCIPIEHKQALFFSISSRLRGVGHWTSSTHEPGRSSGVLVEGNPLLNVKPHLDPELYYGWIQRLV